MDRPPRPSGHARLWAAGAALALVFVVGPLALHFAQQRHNRLTIDAASLLPKDRPPQGGEVFAGTVVAIIERETDSVTGWRPNDFFLWGPGLWADNNANRQRGIIQATRESVRVFKDHLTKVSSDQFDSDLVAADNAFRNDMEKLWLPSAESKLREGVRHLRRYVRGLAADPPASRPINQRNVELIRLFQTWTDLLGDAHANLFRKRVSFWTTDDVFYHAQGFAHVMYHLSRALQQEYRTEVERRPVLQNLLAEVIEALGRAAVLKPVIVLDSRPAGVLANHRLNLDAYITEARQKMYSIREELEK